MKQFKLILILFCILIFSSSNAQNDCTDAITVCGNSGYSGLTSSGSGIQELNSANNCGITETNSLWFKINVNTGGTLGFTLTPSSPDIIIDYDFIVFGPNSTCNNLGSSIRCSSTNPQAVGQGNNLTGLNATETDTTEGPGANGNSFLQWLNVLPGESYYLVVDRPVGNSPFTLTWTGTATFNNPPTFSIPTGTTIDLQKCNATGLIDGVTPFDLTQNDSVIIGTQTGVAVTYHIIENDAITNQNAISNPATFITTQNPQKIYARITNSTTGCFNFSSFFAEIKKGISTVTDQFSICDTTSDGNDTNGLELFNKNSITASIFSGVDLTGTTIQYYASQADVTANNPLPNSFYNTTPNTQTIYLKVVQSANCSYVKPIVLNVIAVPAKSTATLKQCASGVGATNGITTFNLNQADTLFTANNTSYSVSYFLNASAVQNNTSLNTTYNNISNPQQLIAKVTNATTGCSSLSTLNLIVSMVPAQIITSLQKCDDPTNENGKTLFDITSSNLVVGASETVKYYPNYNDALLEQNEIPLALYSVYPNPIAYNSSVFARIENSNDCSSISEIKLIVNRLPKINAVGTNEIICNIPNPSIILDAAITDGSFPGDYNYKWFKNNAAIVPAETNYTLNVNTPGNYSVEVSNSASNQCSKTRTILVSKSDVATFQSINIVDLSDTNSVAITVSNPNGLADYVFSLNDSFGPYQTDSFFNNLTIGQHIIYVKDLNGCGITSKQFYILGAPKFFTPNGDGFNDTWNIKGIDSTKNSNSEIQIFDKFGKLIKQISPIGSGWDGTYNGINLPSEDYWYSVKFEDGRSAKGHFSLKR